MHPQVQQPQLGSCPICGMDLIPLTDDTAADLGPRAMSMSESSRALADIQTSLVERRFPEAEIHLVGKLDYDQTKVKSLTARFPARIDQLFVNFNGVPVVKGDHLASVYSPELFSAQAELITAHRFGPDSPATRAAREKLRLWDLLPEQIDSILKQGVAQNNFELKAPISGIVVSKNVNEGDYLKTGQPLFKIVDLDQLWLQLQAFESDLAWLRIGQEVTFTVEAIPGETFQGRLTFIDPELDRKTRTVNVRVNVPNSDRKLKPGMFARATALARLAQSGTVYAPEYAGKWISPMHPEIVKDQAGQCDICGMDLVPAEQLGYVQDPDAQAPLVIPASSVLRTGKRAVVYIEIPNTERPTYEGREIELGPRAGDFYLVSSGLQAGDRIVTHGAFKIDSALQIQAKPSMMTHTEESDSLSFNLATAKSILPHYLDLQVALTTNDLPSSRQAIEALQTEAGHLHELHDTESLESIRIAFEPLTNALIETVSNNQDAFEQDLYQMHCPMAFNNQGASWLQATEQLRNPYFGPAMLTCGTLERKY